MTTYTKDEEAPLTKITFEAASITVSDVEFDIDEIDRSIEAFAEARRQETLRSLEDTFTVWDYALAHGVCRRTAQEHCQNSYMRGDYERIEFEGRYYYGERR